ncbi:MAG: UDP-N-acetylmuramate dehydrogenase [Terracidiphilus sp.]
MPGNLEENKPLAPFTTFGIGGPARWFLEAASEDEIVEATGWAREQGIALFVLGGGSNLLVADRGFDGLVLRVGLRGIEVVPESGADGTSGAKAPSLSSRDVCGTTEVVPFQTFRSDSVLFRLAAGEDWDGFVQRTVEDGCAGVECLAGIPGTVGGTPVQNVGAYGQEVAPVIELVRAYDLNELRFREFSAAECGFAYRRSRFNSLDRGRFIVTRVDYALRPAGAPTLGYPDLRRAIEKAVPEGREPTLAEVASVVRRVRRSKGMLLVDGDPDCRSAGSFFKNPVVGVEDVRRIAEASGKEPTTFSAGPEQAGRVKVPAAWLIEKAGFTKGYTLGNAGVSSRHTLALINRGGATAAEIMALADRISGAVEARFGITLEMEPVLLGF